MNLSVQVQPEPGLWLMQEVMECLEGLLMPVHFPGQKEELLKKRSVEPRTVKHWSSSENDVWAFVPGAIRVKHCKTEKTWLLPIFVVGMRQCMWLRVVLPLPRSHLLVINSISCQLNGLSILFQSEKGFDTQLTVRPGHAHSIIDAVLRPELEALLEEATCDGDCTRYVELVLFICLAATNR